MHSLTTSLGTSGLAAINDSDVSIIWIIVGVLAIIALFMYIIKH